MSSEFSSKYNCTIGSECWNPNVCHVDMYGNIVEDEYENRVIGLNVEQRLVSENTMFEKELDAVLCKPDSRDGQDHNS